MGEEVTGEEVTGEEVTGEEVPGDKVTEEKVEGEEVEGEEVEVEEFKVEEVGQISFLAIFTMYEMEADPGENVVVLIVKDMHKGMKLMNVV